MIFNNPLYTNEQEQQDRAANGASLKNPLYSSEKTVEEKVVEDPIKTVPKNKAASNARTAVLIQNRPDLTAGAVSPGEDMVAKLHQDFGNVLSGVGTLEKTVRANLARDEIRKNKEAIAQTIGTLPEGSQARNELIGSWVALDSYEQADDDVLSTQASIIDPLIDISYYENNPAIDYETFRAKMIRAASEDVAITLDDSIRWLESAAEDVEVLDTGLVYDVVEMMAPILAMLPAVRLGMVKADVTGEVSLTELFGSGESIEGIKQEFLKAPPEKRAAYVRDLLASLEEHAGNKSAFGISNRTAQWGAMMELIDSLREYQNEDVTVNWSRVVENVGSALSIPFGPVGNIVKGSKMLLGEKLMGARGYRGTYNTAMLSQVEKGNELIRATAEQSAGANALAASREDIVSAALPAPIEEAAEGAIPARFGSDIAAADALISNELAAQLTRSSLPQAYWEVPKAVEDFVERARKSLVGRVGAHIDMSKSQIGDVNYEEGTFVLKSFVGLDPKTGFATLEDAQKAAKNWGMEDGTIHMFDAASGTYKVVPDGLAKTAAGEFYIVKDMKYGFNPEMMGSLYRSNKTGWFADTFGNWVTSGMQRYTGEMRLLFNNAVRGEQALAEQMRRIVAPYENLTAAQRAKVDKVLYANNGVKTFTVHELKAMHGFSDQEVVGYLSFRNAMDATLDMLNKQEYQRAIAAGERWLKTGTGEDMLGKQLVNMDEGLAAYKANKTLILDAETGAISAKPIADLEAAYRNGGYLVRLSNSVEQGDELVEWALVMPGGKATVTDVPKNVFKGLPGYMPRFVDHQYVVMAERPVKKNGVWQKEKQVVPIAFAKDLAEAEAYANKLNANAPKGTVYSASATKETAATWSSNPRATFELENLMFYQKRSEALDEIAGRQAYVDPQEALNRTINLAANKVWSGRLIENYQAKWMQNFGHLYPAVKGFPRFRRDIKPLDYETASKLPKYQKLKPEERRAAYNKDRDMSVAGWDWMNGMISGPTRFDAFRGEWVAHRMGMALARSSSSLGRAAGNYLVENPDPIKFARSVNFFHQIATVPLKQWLINFPTIALYMGRDPVKTTRAIFADATYLDIMYQAEKNGIKGTGLGKAAEFVLKGGDALSSEDYKALYKNFISRGVGEVHAITATYAKTGMEDSIQAVQSTWQKGKELLGEVGVTSAERHVAASAFSLAARRHAEATGKAIAKFTEKDWQAVVDQGAQIGLNMTKADMYNFQRGLFSAAFQYFAVRAKAAHAVFAGDMTKGEKARSLTALGMLYGAEGVGGAYVITEAMTQLGWNWNEVAAEMNASGMNVTAQDAEKMVMGGITDMAVNQFLDRMFDEEGNYVMVSKSISPLSGLDKSAFVAMATMQTILSGDPMNVIGNLAGASETTIGKYAKLVKDIAGAVDGYKLDSEEKVAMLLHDTVTLTSGGSNLVKMFEGRAIQSIVNLSGQPQAHALYGELAAQGFFGLPQNETNDLYEARYMISGDYTKADKDLDASTAELAKFYAEQLVRSEDFDTFAGRFARIHFLLEGFRADPTANPFVADAIEDGLMKELKRFDEPAVQRMYKMLMDRAQKNELDDPIRVLKIVRNLSTVTNDPVKQSAVDEMLNKYESEKARVEALEE